MAVAVHISPKQLSKDDYERVMRSLDEDGHGAMGRRRGAVPSASSLG
jgi:hypothetical protein